MKLAARSPAKVYEEFAKARRAGTSGKPGGCYAAVFRLKTAQRTRDPVTLVWGKDEGAWKIVGYQVVAP